MSDSTRKKVYSFSALGLALMVVIGAILPFVLRPRAASADSSIPDDFVFSANSTLVLRSGLSQFNTLNTDYGLSYSKYSSIYGRVWVMSYLSPPSPESHTSPLYGTLACLGLEHGYSVPTSYAGRNMQITVALSLDDPSYIEAINSFNVQNNGPSSDFPFEPPSADVSSQFQPMKSLVIYNISGQDLYFSPSAVAFLQTFFVIGSSAGSSDDYDRGYTDGLNKGQSDGFTNPVGTMLNPVIDFMNLKLFGEVSLGNIFSIVMFVLFAIIFIKLFAGG